jgi:hypothetical protein
MTAFVWGIDPAAAGFALVVIADGELIDERKIKVRGSSDDLAARLADLGRAATDEMSAVRDLWAPRQIAFEQPVGRYPAPNLMAAWGVVMAAADQFATVARLVPKEWKRLAAVSNRADGSHLVREYEALTGRPLGKTNALRKPAKQRAILRMRELGYLGYDIDIADAGCIALAGEARLREAA